LKSIPPFEIIFDPNLIQEGETDYARRTANIAMRIALDPSEAGFGALNALLEGLEKTSRRDTWGFSGWPLNDINPRTRGTVVFNGKRSFDFTVDISLLNESGKTIGRNSITLKTGNMSFSPGDTRISFPDGDMGMIRFSNVKVGELSPVLTIVINSVNRIPSRTLNSTGYMRIDTGDLERKMVLWVLASRTSVQSTGDVHLDELIERLRQEELAALDSRQAAVRGNVNAATIREREIARAYADTLIKEGDKATLFNVANIIVLKNIYGQRMDGVAMVGLNLGGRGDFDSEKDAVIFVSYRAPEFYVIGGQRQYGTEGSKILIPAPTSSFSRLNAHETGGAVDGVKLAEYITNGEFNGAAAAGIFSTNIRFASDSRGLASSAEIAKRGDKFTVVFPTLSGEVGDITAYPKVYFTKLSSVQPEAIKQELRELGVSRAEYESPYIFDFNPEFGMGINLINIPYILAVDNVPVGFIDATKYIINLRAQIRIQGMQARCLIESAAN
jgi:hypothetical protein